jgi:phage host-nuclease inhibitor protein Gam
MATKLKTKAQTYAPQTTTDCAADIKKLGDLQREITRQTADMNDAIGEIAKRFQPGLETLNVQIEFLQKGVQIYCEAHRLELTNDGKVKTASFITGEVQWRQRPPSVSVRGAEAVIETLKKLGLSKFVRTKDEVNKEAILNEPDQARGITGITIVTGVEDFVITPAEIETEVAS